MKTARVLGAVLAVGLFLLVCAAPAGAGGRLGWRRHCSPGSSECAAPCPAQAECLSPKGGVFDGILCDLYIGNGSSWTKQNGSGPGGSYLNCLLAVSAGEGTNLART